ncbi:hypothetical protein GTA08_BOTSDO09329 [Neofusicoccum parvum]|uniref:Uncharacterized protein n=1 Tax=Neofusicoccum parvum TaxID=310453 RepID=A0ACB5RQY3_9PEZI|nr:hypothetical protein GTA08_BOTSDO09329 [Neofusicoccum parvum]
MEVFQPLRNHLNALFAHIGKTNSTFHPVDRVYLQGAGQLHDTHAASGWLRLEPMLLATKRRYAWTADPTPLCTVPANIYSKAGFEYLGFTPEMARNCWEAYEGTSIEERMPMLGNHPSFLSIALDCLCSRWRAAWNARPLQPATPLLVIPAGDFTGAESTTVNASYAEEMERFFGLRKEVALEIYQIVMDPMPIAQGSFDFDINDDLAASIMQGLVEPAVVFELILKPRFWLLHRIRMASIWRAERWMAGPNGMALASMLEQLDLSAHANMRPRDQFSHAVRLFKDVEPDFDSQTWQMFLDDELNAIPNDWAPAVVAEIALLLRDWKENHEPICLPNPPIEVAWVYQYQALIHDTWRGIPLIYLWNMA